MSVLKLFFLVNLSLVVMSQRVFKVGDMSVKFKSRKGFKSYPFYDLAVIDQHRFGDAINIKIATKSMRLFKGAIKNLPELENLRLKSCGIEEIPPMSFLNLPRIKLVHLQENRLRYIQAGVFNDMSIEELWLHNNAILNIDPTAFDNMPNLVEIKLNQNLLSAWDSNWFSNTPSLTRLMFSKNRIEKLPRRAFANIKPNSNGGTSIYLNRNRISELHPDAFRGLDSLYELRLKRNMIRSIDNVFSHFSELHILNLERNALTTVDKRTFEKLSEMDELNLARNKLSCVPYEIVAIAKNVNVSGNGMDCYCLQNLRERIKDEGISHSVLSDAVCKD